LDFVYGSVLVDSKFLAYKETSGVMNIQFSVLQHGRGGLVTGWNHMVSINYSAQMTHEFVWSCQDYELIQRNTEV
jgi:hypothetical protein